MRCLRASGILLSGLLCLSLTGSPAPAALQIQYFGDAYGSASNIASVVQLGRSARVDMGTCGTLRAPLSKTNTIASVDARPLATTGAVNTTAAAADVSGTQSARTSANVSAASLLSGLVRAREVRAVSTTSHDAGGFRTSASGSSFVDLVVAGVPISALTGPNTRINLLGFGHVVLNEQLPNTSSTSALLTVNMIHVVITVPNLLVPVGTNLIVGHSLSGLALTNVAGTLDGFAYGTFARVTRSVVSGRSAPVPLGCFGTNGAIEREVVASVTSPPEFTTAFVTNTATGVVSASSATGETTSTVEAANVLSSLVTADVVKADAHSFTDGSRFTFTDEGSSFVNLSVVGFPAVRDQVSPNTRLSIAGLGTLWLKREIFTPNSIEIRMIELVVEQTNVFGLPIGTTIQVAVAHASAH